MAALEDTKTAIEENTDAIQKASHRLVDTARDANKSMSDVTGKFRAGTEHLGVAIDKLVKIAGRSDFAQIVQQAESLATSLERLAALEQSGMLERVMYAMTPPPVDIEG